MSNPVEHYISEFPKDVQLRLREVQTLIRQLAPQAKEVMNYGIPTYVLSENLVHFAGYKHHIGFYPGSGAIAHFSKEISKYKNAKGSVQFPLTEPTPLKLIERMVKFRLKAVAEKDKLKLEKERLTKPFAGTELAVLPAPAQRALYNAGLTTLKKIATKKPEELLALHGFGKSALPIIEEIKKQSLQKK